MEDEVEVIDDVVEEEVADEVIESVVDTDEGEQESQEEEETVVVTIGDEEPEEEPEKAPDWVRDLRKKNREDQRRIKELEAKLEQKEAPAKPVLGEKPTLEGFDYDSDKYEAALDEWYTKKRQVDAEQEQLKKAEEQQQQEWQAKLDAYGEKKAALKVADYDEAEAMAQDMFDATQQGIMVQGADNPALVIYALGKNEKKAKELSVIKDPVKFAFAIAKLETQLKVSGKKAPPPPEKVVTGSGKSSAIDSTLDRLREDAAKTGDYSKVHAYKRKKRA
jgi:hypothetical protein